MEEPPAPVPDLRAEPAGSLAAAPGSSGAALVFALAALGWAALTGFAWWRAQPPPALPASVAADVFSAERALEETARLLGDAGPHPAGSAAGAAVRGRVVEAFAARGYEAEVFSSDDHGPAMFGGRYVGAVHDVVARLEATGSGPAVLLVAHYDSVSAGPGVGDDLAGVGALLEVARNLRASGAPQNPVLFLVTDGEEDALLGARTFAQGHPWMEEVGCVVNVEARGTSGQSVLFETGADNAWLIELYARHAPVPSATSISYEVYRRMPNDTDFSVFRQEGKTGVNFAFIGGWGDYHTANDTLEKLDLGSLQHQGDNLLAMARALSQADLGSTPPGDAVYTDLWGYHLVSLPVRWTLGAALLAAVLIGLAALRAVLGPRADLSGVVAGVLAAGLCVALPVYAGDGVVAALRALRDLDRPWFAYPQATLTCLVATTLAVSLLLASLFARGKGQPRLGYGAAILWTAGGCALALEVPGASYALLVPALVAGLLFLVLPPERGEASAAWGLVPALVLVSAAALWAPVQLGLVDAFGPGTPRAVTLPVAALALWLVPLVGPLGPRFRRGLQGLAWIVAVASFGAALSLADHDAEHPAHVNVHYVLDANEGSASWHVHPRGVPLPAALRELASFEPPAEELLPCADFESDALVAPAPLLEFEAPRFELLEDLSGQAFRIVRGRLFAAPGSYRTLIALRGGEGRVSARVLGRDVQWSGGRWQIFFAMPAEGLELELVVGLEDPPDILLVGAQLGLPPQGAALAAARSQRGVAFQGGDLTLVRTRLPLGEEEPEEEE